MSCTLRSFCGGGGPSVAVWIQSWLEHFGEATDLLPTEGSPTANLELFSPQLSHCTECWTESLITVPTELSGCPYSTVCFLNNCSPVLFPKLPDFRRTFAKRFTDDKNPRNFGWQYCSEQFVWDTNRNLWYVWFKYSRGSKQSSLPRMNEIEMKPPYWTDI